MASRTRRHAEAGPARGRDASRPTQIPARGWLDILYRTVKEFSNDRVTLVAAGITFYLLLALAPTLAAFVSIYGLFFDPGSISEQVAALSGVLPGGAMDILTEQLERLASADQSTLGFAFALSLGLALWSANAGMKALFQGMNVAYNEVEKRGFIKLTLTTLTITILTLVTIIGLIAFNVAFGSLTALTGLDLPNWILNTVTGVVALIALIAFMAALYRFGPSREDARVEWITPGAIVAGLLIVAVSAAFTFYVANFGTYNETYGSLGAIIGFLTWLWLTMIVLLLGGELNSEMEHQTARDTTTGEPQPLGQRNAVMADRVGARYGAKGGDAADPGNFQADRGARERDGRQPHGRGGTALRGPRRPSPLGLALLVGAVGVAIATRGR